MSAPKKLKRFLLLTKYAPTQEQIELAAEQGVELLPGTEYNAFGDMLPPSVINVRGRDIALDGFVVTHPLLALKLLPRCLDIGIFEFQSLGQRDSGRPHLKAIGFHIVTVRSNGGQLVFYSNGTEYGAIETG